MLNKIKSVYVFVCKNMWPIDLTQPHVIRWSKYTLSDVLLFIESINE